jgi:hypothetical protein
MDSLPRNAANKVLRQNLRESAAAIGSCDAVLPVGPPA